MLNLKEAFIKLQYVKQFNKSQSNGTEKKYKRVREDADITEFFS